jgi:hypothetical protein
VHGEAPMRGDPSTDSVRVAATRVIATCLAMLHRFRRQDTSPHFPFLRILKHNRATHKRKKDKCG